MTNRNTTLAGIGAILIAAGNAMVALFDGDPATNFDIAVTLAAVITGIGLIMAKDAKNPQ